MSALGSVQQAAPSSADGAVCRLNVTITFPFAGLKMKSIRVAPSSPNYTITVTGVDIDPVTQGTTQHCIYNLGGIAPYRSTSVTANPTFISEDLWTCEAVQATGTWFQGWSPSPPASTGIIDYAIVGTWGSWDLIVQSPATPPDIIAVAHLTFRTPDPAAFDIDGRCTDGSSGVSSLALTGWQVYQDPFVSGVS